MTSIKKRRYGPDVDDDDLGAVAPPPPRSPHPTDWSVPVGNAGGSCISSPVPPSPPPQHVFRPSVPLPLAMDYEANKAAATTTPSFGGTPCADTSSNANKMKSQGKEDYTENIQSSGNDIVDRKNKPARSSRIGIESSTFVYTYDSDDNDDDVEDMPGAYSVPGSRRNHHTRSSMIQEASSPSLLSLPDEERGDDVALAQSSTLRPPPPQHVDEENSHLVSATLVGDNVIQQEQEKEIEKRIMARFASAHVVEPAMTSKKKAAYICGAVVLLICLVLGTVFGVVFSSSSEESPSEDNNEKLDKTSSPTTAPAPAPPSPSPEDIAVTPTTLPPTISDEEFLLGLFAPLLIQGKDYSLTDTNADDYTPAQRALHWLLFDDPMDLDFYASDEGMLMDRFALSALYFSTNGLNWFDQADFLTNRSVCDWPRQEVRTSALVHRIDCNVDGRVHLISLDFNNLDGPLPPELIGLEFLDRLFAQMNKLSGTIPSEFGSLIHLESFVVDHNLLSGSIPSGLAALPKLENIVLFENLLDGTIPDILTKQTNLEEIYLSDNMLVGTIPEFGSFIKLRRLDLGRNLISGTLPLSLADLNDLDILSVWETEISGTIPTEIGLLSRLTYLDLSFNDLVGTIPNEITLLGNLEAIDLSSNTLSGTIPSTLEMWSQCFYIDFSGNSISGSIPTEIGHLSSVWYLDLQSNELTGSIPSEFASNLQVLRIQRNNLEGSLDDGLCPAIEARFLYYLVEADCESVQCSCCSTCCGDASEACISDPLLVCERYILGWPDLNCRCEQAEDSTVRMICEGDECVACSSDYSSCVMSKDFGYIFDAAGLFSSWNSTIQYVHGRDDTISWGDSFRYCWFAINGEECRFCGLGVCIDGTMGLLFADCGNIDGAGIYDGCYEYGGGIFDAVRMTEEESYRPATCRPQF